MNGTNLMNTADDNVKIYVPKSFSGSITEKSTINPSDDENVKIYSRKADTSQNRS